MSKLLLEEYPLIVLPGLAKVIGLNEAIVLQQLHYWLLESKHERDGRRWVYNTYEGWQDQFPFWSIPTIRRALASLAQPYEPKESEEGQRIARGSLILVGRYNRAGFDKTNWYAIDYEEVDRLEGVIRRSDQNDQTVGSKRSDDLINLISPIPETTTETTREKEVWALCLSDLRGTMTKATFDQLLSGSELATLEDGRAVVKVRSEYAAGWLDGRLKGAIEQALARVNGSPVAVTFEPIEKGG